MVLLYSASVFYVKFYAKYVFYAVIFLFYFLQGDIIEKKLHISWRILSHQSSRPKIRDSSVTPTPIIRTVAIIMIWVNGN
jgi:hypothetical protein